MQEFFSRLSPGDAIPLVSIIGAFLTAIVCWAALQWRLNRRAEIEANLKREMVERGMSAEEICKVLSATSHHRGDD